MKIGEIIPLLVAMITVMGGIIAWVVQRAADRKNAERLRKESLYERLLESIVELSSFGNGAPFLVESQRAWLYATDHVLEAINDYLSVFLRFEQKIGSAPSVEERKAQQDAEGRVRLAIRRDLMRNSRLTESWITDKWKPIASSENAIREYLSRKYHRKG